MLKNMPEAERVPDFPPGPAAYNINPIHNIPGFVIRQPESKVIGNEKKAGATVGPQTYKPVIIDHKSHNVKGTIGGAERGEMIKAVNVPGPGNYPLKSDFDKAAKFHMGIKTSGL